MQEQELCHDAGKSGEKRLRAALTRTPEWESSRAREEAARALAAERGGGSPAAEALRRRTSAQLRKGDLLFLARHWGYRSDIWRARQPRPRTRKPPAETRGGCAAGACGCSAAQPEPPQLSRVCAALLAAATPAAAATCCRPGAAPSLLSAELAAAAAGLRTAGGSEPDAPLWRAGSPFSAAEAAVELLCARACSAGPAAAVCGGLARNAKAQLAMLALQPTAAALRHAAQLLDAAAAFAAAAPWAAAGGRATEQQAASE